MQALNHDPAAALRLLLVQAELAWQDPASNRMHLGALIAGYDSSVDRAAAGSRHVDLIVLPEMFSTGFNMQPELASETMDGATVAWMRAQAAATGAVICGSLAMQTNTGFVNRFLWMRPDGSFEHYDKRHLFRMSGEHEHYAAGRDRLIVELSGWRFCPLVCYDLRVPVFSRNGAGAGTLDYDVLLYVANWPAPRQYAWETLLAARAIENLSYVVGVNRVGNDGNGFAFDGGTCAIGPAGEQLLLARAQTGVHEVLLSAAMLQPHRERFPAWRDADSFSLR